MTDDADVLPGAPQPAETIEIDAERVVAGGAALGHLDDGRVVLIAGALPGERVVATVTRTRRDVVFADTVDVLSASGDRIAPPCPFVAAGCGGCDWQHVQPDAQSRLKRDIVIDALRRLGRVPDAEARVAAPIGLSATGYRTTLRGLVDGEGRVALRRAASHEPVTISSCLVAHPLVDDVILHARFPGAREVTIRAGARTGERLVAIDGGRARARGLAADVRRDEYHEIVDGVHFRISARAFFQPHADAPAALARIVRQYAGTPGALADLYCGVGLFAALVPAGRVVAIESNTTSARDAQHNLAAHPNAQVRAVAVEGARLRGIDVVIADPARAGLGAQAVEVIAASGAQTVVLVSCDVAAAGRDIRLLSDAGFALEQATPLDQLPNTSHVEVVSALRR